MTQGGFLVWTQDVGIRETKGLGDTSAGKRLNILECSLNTWNTARHTVEVPEPLGPSLGAGVRAKVAAAAVDSPERYVLKIHFF